MSTDVSALAVHVVFNHYPYWQQGTGTKALSRARPGLGVSYLRQLGQRWGVSALVEGAMQDGLNTQGRENGSKQLLLSTVALATYQLIVKPVWLNPFLQTGWGVAKRGSEAGSFVGAGAGLQVHFTRKSFLLLDMQYRQAVVGRPGNHLHYGIGLAGYLSQKRKTVVHPVPVWALPAALPVVPAKPAVDTDGDGMQDPIDACPFTPGIARYKGCPVPDSDADGINDEQDSCVHLPGTAKYRGCPIPDTDADGMDDETDRCPVVPGVPAYQGCPELVDTLYTKVQAAARHCLFRNNSAVLLPASFPALRVVAELLRKEQGLYLNIEGHTDNQGSAKSNEVLSLQRAMAVRRYLQYNGIAAGRLTAKGYGQNRPVANNATAGGRTSNRRVEMKLYSAKEGESDKRSNKFNGF